MPDITCEGSVSNAQQSHQSLAGGCNVRIDLSTKTVHLHYQPDQLSHSQIETALAIASHRKYSREERKC
ncbi:heavy-metal-associated domain-containing protein [Ktedonobacter racemifer]|uniref:heavy-metal-associated domain-containing protein n=1 Tax=Ktedonobacter racemifer TaxID=363277 RepID=UPI0030830CF0